MIRRVAPLMLAGLAACCATTVRADDSPGWQQSIAIYGMGAAINGTAQIGNVAVPVDVSISELFDNLEFGAMGVYRIENDTWSGTVDASFMALGGGGQTQGGRASANMDMDQLLVMATIGRKVVPGLELRASLVYIDLSTDLDVRLLESRTTASRDADWIDPAIGLRFTTPFGGDKWDFALTYDVGGFGVGSELMYATTASVHRQVTPTFGWFMGYRYLAFDCEDGKGSDYQRYDLSEQGPGVGVSFAF